MSNDAIIENAQNAAATPASGPPAAPDGNEARRQEIMREADYWSSGPKTRALRDEMKRITSAREAIAAEDQKKADRAAKTSPAEQRIKKANENPALWDKHHMDRDAARRELREAIAAAATPEERQAMVKAPLSENRAVFGLEAPVLPPTMLETYESEYSASEADFLVAARQHGLPADVVRDLRDDGVKLGTSVDGKPLDEAVLDSTLTKYGDKLTDDQKKHLKAYWRRIEGGGVA